MLGWVKQVFRHPQKPKWSRTSGTSRLTVRVSYRYSLEDFEILQRRADGYCGGNKSYYIDHIMSRELNRDHHKKREDEL